MSPVGWLNPARVLQCWAVFSEGSHGRKIWHHSTGVAGRIERCDVELAFADAQAGSAVALFVQVGVGLAKGGLLGCWTRLEAVHIVVPIALDMGHANQVDQGQVLLHRQTGLHRQVFGRHEIAPWRGRFLVPGDAASGVQQRAVHPFAGFAGDAGVAPFAGHHKGVEQAIGFVHDDGHAQVHFVQVDVHRVQAVDGLFDEQDAGHQPLQGGLGTHARQQFVQLLGALVLLVAVQRGVVGLGQAVQHRGDGAEPINVGVDAAADLEFVIPVTVDLQHFLQSFGQSVVDGLGYVLPRDGVQQAHGVPRVQCCGWLEAGQKRGHVQALK